MVMKDVIIKSIRSTWNILDVLNNKFYEMLIILDETFASLKAQAPTAEAYDALTKQLKESFKQVFEWLEKLKSESIVASEAGSSHLRGGERKRRIQCMPVSNFLL